MSIVELDVRTDHTPCALVDVYDIRRVADELGRLYRGVTPAPIGRTGSVVA